MAWNSFYLAAGIVKTCALPLYRGSEGTHHIPADGACIVAADHSGFLDGPLLALAHAEARLKPLHMIAYEESFARWPAGWILRSGGAIPFRRGDRGSRAGMMAAALGWLAGGGAVGIFLGHPRPGAALLALESGAPVVPAAVIGGDALLPAGRRFPRFGRRAAVRFGRPVLLLEKERLYAALPKDERDMLVKNLSYRIMRAVGELSGRECRE